jgi:hypothetical protein
MPRARRPSHETSLQTSEESMFTVPATKTAVIKWVSFSLLKFSSSQGAGCTLLVCNPHTSGRARASPHTGFFAEVCVCRDVSWQRNAYSVPPTSNACFIISLVGIRWFPNGALDGFHKCRKGLGSRRVRLRLEVALCVCVCVV